LFFLYFFFFFFSSRRRHTRYIGDWSSDVCSSDLLPGFRRRFGYDAPETSPPAGENRRSRPRLSVSAPRYCPIRQRPPQEPGSRSSPGGPPSARDRSAFGNTPVRRHSRISNEHLRQQAICSPRGAP